MARERSRGWAYCSSAFAFRARRLRQEIVLKDGRAHRADLHDRVAAFVIEGDDRAFLFQTPHRYTIADADVLGALAFLRPCVDAKIVMQLIDSAS